MGVLLLPSMLLLTLQGELPPHTRTPPPFQKLQSYKPASQCVYCPLLVNLINGMCTTTSSGRSAVFMIPTESINSFCCIKLLYFCVFVFLTEHLSVNVGLRQGHCKIDDHGEVCLSVQGILMLFESQLSVLKNSSSVERRRMWELHKEFHNHFTQRDIPRQSLNF